MAYPTIMRLLPVLSAALVFSAPGIAHAAEGTYYKVADGVMIYLGVVPSEIVLGHPRHHPEAQMHGGTPDANGRYHVLVALFQSTTGARIADAQVTATVGPLGRAATDKTLERMTVAGAATYGNYFAMPGPGPYRIEVRIRHRDAAREVTATFDYRKPDE